MFLLVYGDDGLGCGRLFEWRQRFREGWEVATVDSRNGRACTSRTNKTVAKNRKVVRGHRRLS